VSWLEWLFVFAVGMPGAAFAGLSGAWLTGVRLRERAVVWVTGVAFTASTLALAALWTGMRLAGRETLVAGLGEFFRAEDYRFPLELLADPVSLPLLGLTAVLTGLVGWFSARYMHREEGFLYFFLLLHLFGFGAMLLFAAATFDLMVAGWEFVGITSVLLIAYFHQRREPVQNALRVFAIYRICDLGLLLGVAALHHFAGSASLWRPLEMSVPAAELAGLLFLFAAAGKAAQFPFSGWLPRAMEGPTPSSAIFYGAISVHAGAYLLLRSEPLLAQSGWLQAAVAAIGALSAVFGVLIGRACTDAKTSLAWASVTQLGLIFVEIGFGFTSLALWHMCGHAVVRTLQFLKAPSALHEFHQIHAAAGGHLEPAGQHHEELLPLRVRMWLYRLALDRGHMDTLLDRFVVRPTLALSRRLNPEGAAPPARAERSFRGSAVAGEADA
jgi:NADH-quinone oxidoreductase subunit L